MSYRYAVLWELEDDPQPVGIVVERDGYVLIELPREHAMPKRYDHAYRVLGANMIEIVYAPGDDGYFEQVLSDLARQYAVMKQSEVHRSDDGSVLELLQEHVLAPRTRRRRGDYHAGIFAIGTPQPIRLGRYGQPLPFGSIEQHVGVRQRMQAVA